ncbi:hypothetical protein WJM93_15915 [Lactiplantibacillus plantarum]
MTDKEKRRVLDKLKGVSLGTTEAEHVKLNLEKLEKQIRDDES